MDAETTGTIAGFVLTLMIFGYLLDGLPPFRLLYRIAVYILVGVAAAFTAIITVEGVLIPLLSRPGEIWFLVIGLVLGLLLLLNGIQRISWVSNIALAFLVGVGAVVAFIGAISGTLIPITVSTGNEGRGDLVRGLIILIGVVSTLWYFNYLSRRNPTEGASRLRPFYALNRGINSIGKGFIVIALGAFYGAAILTSLAILSERIAFLIQTANVLSSGG